MRALDLEMVEQTNRIGGHVLERVTRRSLVAPRELPARRDWEIVEPGRPPDVTIVEAHDEEPAHGKSGAEILAPADHLRPEPHDQQERRIPAVAEALVAQVQTPHCCELLAGPFNRC